MMHFNLDHICELKVKSDQAARFRSTHSETSATLALAFARLTIAGQFTTRRNVSRENLVDAGNHTPRPCLARFAVVMNPVAAGFPHEVPRESP